MKRGPIDLPPLTLSYVFAGWDGRGWLKLEYRLDWDDGPQALRTIYLAPGADGAVAVKLLGGRFALLPPSGATNDTTLESPRPKPDVLIEF